METSWVCSWFERVLRLADRVKPGRKQVFIADRSPFRVQFYTVHVQVERELLWRRIIARLELEPERLRLNEHKREWMEETLAFYESFKWDLTVDNDERSVATIAGNISRLLRERDDTFEAVYKCTKPRVSPRSDSSTRSTDSECESTEEEQHEEVEWNATAEAAHKPTRSIIAFNNTPLDGAF
ncbi:hypothetical protein BBJ29_005331 [Phytophthora kernoviae]|uniref:Uncharacterized protein n=1 Tax=Phytophthora kernoviae TaxID=325452 RepID=A0A3F2S3P6_9STRA|nr:hypothetical protein BBJ29_005331 [Phytophthora kernoviae]RLN69596.1 hypothetical protein BBP00_00000264 [Phytophthora kernoviae]